MSDALGEPLEQTHGRFGEYVAPHLIRVAGPLVDPSWRTLDVVEHADALIRSMVHHQQVYSDPPTHEIVRVSPSEIHLVYSSRRKMCAVAAGIVRGVAKHFGELLSVEESACMRRGSPFCSFVLRCLDRDARPGSPPAGETISVPTSSAAREADHAQRDPGLANEGPAATEAPPSIGPYRVLGVLARGAMGLVYRAHDGQLDRPVAIKVMQPSRARDPGARQRFVREGKAAASISHPHVLTVYGVGDHEGYPYIVMQHLDGVPLSACPLPIPVPEALRIGREIASGLAAAHARGFIHRDIKPQNIFLEGPGRSVRIIDFGLARGKDEPSSTVTVEGFVVGTPAYMSPERLGDDPLDARTDLFGLGVVLYELIAGRLPFDGDSMLSMLASIARGNPLPLSKAAAEAPPDVCNLVMGLMAHRPEHRPADAGVVEAELATLEQRIGAT
jgi:tRNA A-37 threonylcarbamoyl transferase component Bud32/predicted hydrocarbon binding protein